MKKYSITIIQFLKNTFEKTKIDRVVLGLSGGIDSAVCLYLLHQVLPPEHIHLYHLHYFQPLTSKIQLLTLGLKIPERNIHIVSIKESVDIIHNSIGHAELVSASQEDNQKIPKQVRDDATIRLGNIMARVRMIHLFDAAKKLNALVCGTENKSEHYLGYFTRFGDAASDIEPITHLYKTEVKQLARELNIPQEIIDQAPTAGLWSGQTDEGEFGFTYQEADNVMKYYIDEQLSREEILKKNLPHTTKIIDLIERNAFKLKVPWIIPTAVDIS